MELPSYVRGPHEKLIEEHKETFTKDRLALEEISKKLNEGTLSLDSIIRK